MNPTNAFLLSALIAFLPCPNLAQQGQAPPGTPPPLELESYEKRPVFVYTSYPGLQGGANYGLSDRTVTITWERDFSSELPETQNPKALGSDGTFISTQEEGAGFWPTEVCGFGTDKICVAGKTNKGKARIQVWTLSSTEVLADPYDDPVSGRRLYPESHIPIASKTGVYNVASNGTKFVRTMFRNHGNPNCLFVLFTDSSDLFELDTVTGTLTTVVTLAQEPTLAGTFRDRLSSHHTVGYMYGLVSTSAQTTLLMDSDFDGILDLADTRVLVGEQWYAGPVDFSDITGYVEQY